MKSISIQNSGFLGTLVTTSSPIYETTFATDDWVHNDATKTNISSNALNITNVDDNTNDSCSKDLGSIITALATAFRLRFELTYSGLTGTAIRTWIGLSDLGSTANFLTTQEFIGFMLIGNNSGTNSGAQSIHNSYLLTGFWDQRFPAFTSVTSTKYYFQILRTTSTSYTVSISSTSSYTGDIASAVVSGTGSAADDLRYIVFRNEVDPRANSVIFKIENMKLWNNADAV